VSSDRRPASQAILKSYECVETTVVNVKSEAKSRQLNRCYHGADGNMQKIPLTTALPTQKKRALRGRIAEAKKEEIAAFVEGTADGALVQTLEFTAKVAAIDKASRKVTLVSAEGIKQIVEAGPEAINLDQIRVDDQLKVNVTEELIVRLSNDHQSMSVEIIGPLRNPDPGQPSQPCEQNFSSR
jgi:hypothetical protein